TINGEPRSAEVEPRTLLVDFIRTHLGLTGTHVGCDTTSCGACTVILDGKPVKSCTVLAVQAHGSELRTVEGLRQNGRLHPIQAAFKEHHGLQCGLRTPGTMLVGAALLEQNPAPAEEEDRGDVPGNLRRGTGDVTMVAADTAA